MIHGRVGASILALAFLVPTVLGQAVPPEPTPAPGEHRFFLTAEPAGTPDVLGCTRTYGLTTQEPNGTDSQKAGSSMDLVLLSCYTTFQWDVKEPFRVGGDVEYRLFAGCEGPALRAFEISIRVYRNHEVISEGVSLTVLPPPCLPDQVIQATGKLPVQDTTFGKDDELRLVVNAWAPNPPTPMGLAYFYYLTGSQAHNASIAFVPRPPGDDMETTEEDDGDEERRSPWAVVGDTMGAFPWVAVSQVGGVLLAGTVLVMAGVALARRERTPEGVKQALKQMQQGTSSAPAAKRFNAPVR